MNVYYDPEKFGLEIVGEVDLAGSYEFRKFVVWRSADSGALFYGTDRGCSCPTPFEDRGLDALTRADRFAIAQAAQEWARDNSYDYDDDGNVIPGDVTGLIEKVMSA